MTHYCPHCGTNLTADKPIERDGWELTADFARFAGVPVALTKQQASILYTLAATDRPIRTDTISARAGSTMEDTDNWCKQMVCRIRKLLGDRCPIETVPGRGYRWAA